MNIFQTMILSSSTLFLLYVIINYIQREIFSPQAKYNILKIALIYSLVPLGYIKYIAEFLSQQIFKVEVFSRFSIDGRIQTLTVFPEGYYANISYRNNFLLVIIWLSIAIIVFLLCLKRHVNCRNNVLKIAYEMKSDETLNLLNKYKDFLNIKRNVRIYTGEGIAFPFTIGIFRPIIVMPQSLSNQLQEFVICHELCHIKRYDVVVKYLQMMVVSMYWFNPLVYILNDYLDNVCEQSCDEIVTRNMSTEQCRQYGHLIVDMASAGEMRKLSPIIKLSDGKNNLTERIIFIMSKKRKMSKSALCLTLGMVICSSFPALAFQKPIHILWENQPEENIFLENFNQDISFREIGSDYAVDTNRVLYDRQFTDQDGNIYPIENDGNYKTSCDKHDYFDGIYNRHTKNKDGSCVMRSYNCQRCSKCGILKYGLLINESTNTTCPH